MRYKNKLISHAEALSHDYDVVIVGSGISGSIVAKELGEKGYKVLILEAGPGKDLTMDGYDKYWSCYLKWYKKVKSKNLN